MLLIVRMFDLHQIQCPQRGGINFPCVICQACEIGKVESLFMNEIFIEKTVNSTFLSLNIELKDDFEELLLQSYLEQIGNKTSFISKKPQPGFQVTFYIDEEMVKTQEQEEKIMKFIENFHNYWKSFVSRAKTYLNKWEREVVNETLRNLPVK